MVRDNLIPRESAAWADQSLDVHPVRLDLAEERRQAIWGAFRLSRFTRRTQEFGSGTCGQETTRLRAAPDQRAALTQDMHRALVARIAALQRYRERPLPLGGIAAGR